MDFSKEDKAFMNIAIEEAKHSLKEGDFPVGAVLTIDDKMIDKAGNSIHSNKDWVSHAEMKLLLKYSSMIKGKIKEGNSAVTLYTTLEPCLMCFGTSVLNRISRIVYACPDPFTGAGDVYSDALPTGYNKLPMVSGGLMREESYDLIVAFMQEQRTDKWNQALDLYKKMGRS